MKYMVDIQNEDYETPEFVIEMLTKEAEFRFDDGNPNFKVTVKQIKPIDEEELDTLAFNIYNMCGETPECLIVPEHPNKEIYDWMKKCFNIMIWGIKLGYRKAKEE